MLLVRAVDDINLIIVSDPDNPARVGHHILWPNSVRRDVTMSFALDAQTRISPKPFKGTLEQEIKL